MLSAEEMDRLPALLRDIVVKDRILDTLGFAMAKPVVDFAHVQVFRQQRAVRRELTDAAAQLWGHRLGGDGTAPC